MRYIHKHLIRDRAAFFSNEAQKTRLRILVRNHEERNTAAKADEFVDSVLELAPIEYFRRSDAVAFILTAQSLSAALSASRSHYAEHGSDDPTLVEAVNDLSTELAKQIKGLTLSDVDKVGRPGRRARRRNAANFFRRMDGKVDHKAKWDPDTKTWQNWNRDISLFPVDRKLPKTRQAVAALIRNHDPIRLVAGGHAFNTSSDTGGKKGSRVGILITLDDYKLSGRDAWKRIDKATASSRYNLSAADAQRVVCVAAGMRLRDFTAAMAAKNMSLPVAGSAGAQSIGGLLATDLHSTGNSAGFLSQQVLEVLTLDAEGKGHRFVKDESKDFGESGRWTWIRPGGSRTALSKLPVSGAIGMAGVVVEVVVKLVKIFNFVKDEQLVPRKWAWDNVHRLLDPTETDPLFAYDHVSFYLGGGNGPNIRTVRLNTWKRTIQTPPPDAQKIKRKRELVDHIGSAFLPNSVLAMSNLKAPVPGSSDTSGASLLALQLNGRDKQVLPANLAFARKLYFQHDEIESGIPLATNGGAPDYNIFRRAIKEVHELLQREEFKTIIEIRFTPHASEAMLGPGTGGPTCYIELAPSMTQHSRERIVQVFHRFDDLLRDRFNARPHLGKKTSARAADMRNLYGHVWDEFNAIRKEIDPAGKFLPKDNELLNRLFS